jgi:protein tyrosine phosphatase (PTP) superfamily phosphohydrolase (DUF442 family)
MKGSFFNGFTLSSWMAICAMTIGPNLPDGSAQQNRQSERLPAQKFEAPPKAEAPIILCIDDKPTSGGQPSDSAYAKAAANGFRSILTLRAASDGIDTARERLLVEKHQLRYFNLPVVAPIPTHKQIDQFLKLVRDKSNHPMLANCAYIDRIAPYMMMFHLVEQGWSEERALDDASRSGLRRDDLQALARTYLKSRPR